MNHKLVKGINMWKRNGNTTIVLFSVKRLEILHKKEVNPIVMEHFNNTSSINPDLLTSSIPIDE